MITEKEKELITSILFDLGLEVIDFDDKLNNIIVSDGETIGIYDDRLKFSNKDNNKGKFFIFPNF